MNLIERTAVSSEAWERMRRRNALALFDRAAKNVPAYASFLEKCGVDPETVRTWEDFAAVPATSKDAYVRAYALEKLLWEGTFSKPGTFTATSGSTGERTYFVRSHAVDTAAADIHELFFCASVSDSREPTLVVVCFGMGIWIGGLITYQAFRALGERGYPISIVTPGVNKTETFKALRTLVPHFKQIVLAGYPPFIKDILDEAKAEHVSFEGRSVRLLFAAEGFTETFRDRLVESVGIEKVLTGTANIYGSADIGAMAIETPLSILARRIAVRTPDLFKSLFGDAQKLPTLAQYVPSQIAFEASNGELLLTGDSAMPLVRYAIGDNGGVMSFDELVRKFGEVGLSLADELENAGVRGALKLPLVYVYQRKDFSATLYGLQIFPETIREVLLENPWEPYLSGKLALRTAYDTADNQYLEINIERKRGAEELSPEMIERLAGRIVTVLCEKSAEFKELSNHLSERAKPALVLWPAEDPRYFRSGVKQKWTVK